VQLYASQRIVASIVSGPPRASAAGRFPFVGAWCLVSSLNTLLSDETIDVTKTGRSGTAGRVRACVVAGLARPPRGPDLAAPALA